MTRKIFGRAMILVGFLLAYMSTGFCLAGAWLADIDWNEGGDDERQLDASK